MGAREANPTMQMKILLTCLRNLICLPKTVIFGRAKRAQKLQRKDPLLLFAQPLPVSPNNLPYTPKRVRFNFGVKIRRLSCKCLSLSGFLRRGAATPQKTTFLTRPVGAFEIVAPTLERTLPGTGLASDSSLWYADVIGEFSTAITAVNLQ